MNPQTTEKQYETVLAESEGEGEIDSYEGTIEECIVWSNNILSNRSSGMLKLRTRLQGSRKVNYEVKILQTV